MDSITPETSGSLEHKAEVLRKFLALIRDVEKEGVEPLPDTIGFHGTSQKTIDYILEYGSLPGGVFHYEEKDFPSKGDIYFSPLPRKVPKEVSIRIPPESDQSAFDNAEGYSEIGSRNSYLLEKLGMDPFDPKYYQWAVEIQAPSPKLTNLKDGPSEVRVLTFEKIDRALDEIDAEGHLGYVLGLSTEVTDLYDVSPGDSGDDLRIHVPQGLPLRLITEIYPLGPVEQDFVKSLETST